ncbi:hypothetical protein Tco_1155732 [Tanacetum coccineum]
MVLLWASSVLIEPVSPEQTRRLQQQTQTELDVGSIGNEDNNDGEAKKRTSSQRLRKKVAESKEEDRNEMLEFVFGLYRSYMLIFTL